jgi:ABC-type uncharacterized transport system involved in gliding motility auxiliary subunit
MPAQNQQMQFNRGPSYVPLNTGLEKLLKHYGISVKKSYVMDENCYTQEVPTQFGGGERKIYFAPLIKNEFINKDLDFMGNIKGLVAMKVSPLILDTQRLKENGIDAVRIFSSSEKSWEMKERINLNPMFMRPPATDEEQKSYPLAYVLEGAFPSYFSGKQIPEKKSDEEGAEKSGDADKPGEAAITGEKEKTPDEDLAKIKGEGLFLEKGEPAKIFIMAASEMLKDNVLDEKGRTPNAMFILNMIDFLNDRAGIATMRSKEQRFNPLRDVSAGTKAVLKSFNIAGLPILVVIFGLLVLLRRRARKKQIQMMFSG